LITSFNLLKGFIMGNTQPKAVKMTKQGLIQLGVGLAVMFFDAEKKADDTKRVSLMKLAKAHSHNPESVTAILEGYATKLAELGYSDSIIKVRKSEAKAVFDAVGKTEVSEFNTKALEKFEGNYNAFIDLARQLRGVKERTSGERTRTKTSLTAKQEQVMETNLGKASVSQLVDIGETVVTSINKNATPQLAGFQTLLLIQASATQLLNNKKVEKFFHNAAKAILEVVEPAIEQAGKAMSEAKKAEEAMKQGTTQQVQDEVKEGTV
jgi:hypothetical protein